jgi:hypothetical protein
MLLKFIIIIVISSLLVVAGISVGVYFSIKNKKQSGDQGKSDCYCINVCPKHCGYSGGKYTPKHAGNCPTGYTCPSIECASTPACAPSEKCPSGHYKDDKGECTPCPAGTFNK